MKRTLVLTLAAFLSLSLAAQDNAIDKYFKAHLENAAFEKFEVTERTFELIAEMETEDAEERRVLEALSNIEGIKVLANKNTPISEEYYQEAMDKLLPDGDYADLIVLENAGDNVRFLIRETADEIQEFVAVIGADESFVVASLYGKIDIASLSKIMQVMRHGGGWLKSLNNVHGEEIQVEKSPLQLNSTLTKTNINDIRLSIYPNPATDFVNVDLESGVADEMQIGFFSLLGKEVQNVGKVGLPYKIDLKQLPAGTYFLRITDKAGDYKNFKIVKQFNN